MINSANQMTVLVLAHKADKDIIELQQIVDQLHLNEQEFRNWAVMPTSVASLISLKNVLHWCGKWSRKWDSSEIFPACTII
jgi:hypothetical protein